MRYGVRNVVVLTLILIVFATPVISFAQPLQTILIDGEKQGKFSIQDVGVYEKEFYNVIFLNIAITVPNIELEDKLVFSPTNFNIINEKNKKYIPDPSECELLKSYEMTGKKGPNGVLTVCYSVEKTFDKFKIRYSNVMGKTYQIGTIDLNVAKKITKSDIDKLTKKDSRLRDCDALVVKKMPWSEMKKLSPKEQYNQLKRESNLSERISCAQYNREILALIKQGR